MGLSISHDAWQAPYGVFSQWRTALAIAAGYPTKSITRYGYVHEEIDIDYEAYELKNFYGKWDKGTEPEDPLMHLFIHSDCEGKIDRKYLKKIIDRLEEILPNIPNHPDLEYTRWNWYPRTVQFIEAAKEARKARHHLLFH